MEDIVIDYNSIGGLPNPKIPTHVVTLPIDNKPAILVNLYRLFLCSYVANKRFTNISVYSSDGMVIREHVVNRIQFYILSRNTPIGKYKLSVSNNTSSPLIVDFADFANLGDYINPGYICAIKQGTYINISAEVEENTYSGSHHTRNNFISNFDRTRIITSEKDIDYNTGLVKFIYQDNISAVDLMKLVKELINEKLDKILHTVESEDREYFILTRNIGIITIKNDYSSIIANALLVYIYRCSQIYHLKDKSHHNNSQLEIHNITLNELKPLVKKAVELLKSDL
jgi:hypothetical protein